MDRGSAWYVVQSKPRQENLVISQLKQHHIRSFFPLIEMDVMQFGRVVPRVQPLFPSYIFAHFDYNLQGSQVIWNFGTRRVISFSGEPAPVAPEIIRLIKERANRNGVVRLDTKFKPNQPVRIVYGPFKDLEGIFVEEMTGTDRVKVLLTVMGMQPRIELSAAMLRPR